ncbi:hypothetical protein N7454_002297 [Penicillium verhagenii]|nr:hypothetical protein N7454_002297 [Penicillium verhagenii]
MIAGAARDMRGLSLMSVVDFTETHSTIRLRKLHSPMLLPRQDFTHVRLMLAVRAGWTILRHVTSYLALIAWSTCYARSSTRLFTGIVHVVDHRAIVEEGGK